MKHCRAEYKGCSCSVWTKLSRPRMLALISKLDMLTEFTRKSKSSSLNVWPRLEESGLVCVCRILSRRTWIDWNQIWNVIHLAVESRTIVLKFSESYIPVDAWYEAATRNFSFIYSVQFRSVREYTRAKCALQLSTSALNCSRESLPFLRWMTRVVHGKIYHQSYWYE